MVRLFIVHASLIFIDIIGYSPVDIKHLYLVE